MIRRTPDSTLTDTLFHDPTLFRSAALESRSEALSGTACRGVQRPVPRRVPEHPLVLTLADAAEKLEAWRTYYNEVRPHGAIGQKPPISLVNHRTPASDGPKRSAEHTSELQSLMRNSYAVFCLKQTTTTHTTKIPE